MPVCNLIGQKFGRLTVIDFADKSNTGKTKWMCKCDCGTVKSVLADSLKSGKTISCGCARLEAVKLKHINRRHGMSRQRLYTIWRGMRQRCRRNKKYKHISVCKAWDLFESFRDWAYMNGYSDDLTIDRIDNNKGYSPDNCRWASYKVQENNRSNNTHITINGETHTISEWSEVSGIGRETIRYRLNHNWNKEDLLLKPNCKKRG